LSLIPAIIPLLGPRNFPACSPRRGGEPANFNKFGIVLGNAGEVFPAIREFAAPLAFAATRRQ
jgi:hypothetical protein